MSDKINDDVFACGNGMTQCISGFGRNTIELIRESLPEDERQTEAFESIRWHVNELVRWCRAMNGDLQRAKAAEAAAKEPV